MGTILFVLIVVLAIVSIILLVAANVTLIFGAARFVENAFAQNRWWGWGMMGPPAVAVVAWGIGRLLAALFDLPELAVIGQLIGTPLLVVSPAACLGFAILRWRAARGPVATMAGSAAYIVAWVPLMMYLLGPFIGRA